MQFFHAALTSMILVAARQNMHIHPAQAGASDMQSPPKTLMAATGYHACAAVIKPIYGAASIGVVKVTSLEELKSTYRRVNKEMAGARIVAGAITTGEEAEGDESAVRPRTRCTSRSQGA